MSGRTCLVGILKSLQWICTDQKVPLECSIFEKGIHPPFSSVFIFGLQTDSVARCSIHSPAPALTVQSMTGRINQLKGVPPLQRDIVTPLVWQHKEWLRKHVTSQWPESSLLSYRKNIASKQCYSVSALSRLHTNILLSCLSLSNAHCAKRP